jgi:hypothetical protein
VLVCPGRGHTVEIHELARVLDNRVPLGGGKRRLGVLERLEPQLTQTGVGRLTSIGPRTTNVLPVTLNAWDPSDERNMAGTPPLDSFTTFDARSRNPLGQALHHRRRVYDPISAAAPQFRQTRIGRTPGSKRRPRWARPPPPRSREKNVTKLRQEHRPAARQKPGRLQMTGA